MPQLPSVMRESPLFKNVKGYRMPFLHRKFHAVV